jgi:Domain of unknown function (DUF222)/HNH endonuclease
MPEHGEVREAADWFVRRLALADSRGLVRVECYAIAMDGELEQLGERIAEQAAHLDAAMHRLLADLREFDGRGGWHVQGAMSCAHWLAWRVGWDLVTARERVRVACKLAEFPMIDDALRRGEVSYSKVRALVRVATPANEALLLDYARLMTASQLEKLSRKYALVQRHCRDPHPLDDEQRRYVRRRDTEDGMVKIEAVLHPEEAELIWAMLDHAATQLVRDADQPASEDSAESPAAAQPIDAAVRPLPEDAATGGRDDSAESPGVHAIGAAVCPLHEEAATGGRDDSAESPAVPASGAAVRPLREDAAMGGRDDSAESTGTAQPRGAGDGASHPAAPMAGNHDSVESREGIHGEIARIEPTLDRSHGEIARIEPTLDRSHGASARIEPTLERPASVLHQRADAAKRAFSRADALVSLAQAYLRGDRRDRSPIEITLTIPQSSLRADVADPLDVGEIGESFVSTEVARRLSCDAGVVKVVEDEHGVPLSVGRKHRTISGALKRALYKRDAACTYPGCTHRIFLEGHHIQHWADGGETSLQNAALLCSQHHRYVHEYGYTIDLGPDQRPRFRDPRGRLVAVAPAPPVVTELGWPRIRAANEALAIDAETNACEWDGRPVDYGTVVGHLVVADGLQ